MTSVKSYFKPLLKNSYYNIMCSLKRLVQAVHESLDPTGLSRELSSKSQVICEFGLNRFWGAFCANI